MTQQKTGTATVAPESHGIKWVKRIFLIGSGAAVLQVSLFLLAYSQTGAWQILVLAILMVLCTACLTQANRLIIIEKTQRQVPWLIFAGMAMYTGQELLLSGATFSVAVINILFMLLLGSLILPQRWKLMFIITSTIMAEMFLLNWYPPLDRFIPANSSYLTLYVIPGNTMIVGTMAGLPFVSLFRRIRVIRKQLLISFISIVLIPLIIISLVSVKAGLRTARDHVVNQLESVATLKTAEINAWTNNLEDSLNFLVHEYQTPMSELVSQNDPMERSGIGSHDELRSRFVLVLKRMKRFEELFLMDPHGKVVFSTDESQEGKTRAEQQYFGKGLKKPRVHPPFYSLSLGRMSVVAVHPVVNRQGMSIGVFAGRARMGTLNEIMLERAGLGETGETYLVGANHALLTGARFLEAKKEERRYLRTEGVNAAVQRHHNGSGLYNDYRNKAVVGVYRWLPELKIALVAEQDQWEAFFPIYSTLGLNGGVVVIAIIIAIVAALFVTRSIAVPLAKLAETAEEIENGNLDLIAKVQREDEIGKLAHTFNSMTLKLRQFIKRLEHKVVELKDAYDIIDKSPAVAFLWKKGEGWPVEFVTNNVKTIFGYSAKEFVSGKVAYGEIVHPDDLDRVAKEVNKAGTEQESESLTHEPYRIIAKDGKIKWIEDKTYIRRDEKGQITHYHGIVEDITERKAAEEAQQFTQFAIDHSYDAAFWMGNDARFIYVNKAACNVLGYSREELLTMTVHDIDPDFPQEIWPEHWKNVKRRGFFVVESSHMAKDGRVFPVEISINYLKFGGKEYNCAFAKDITERKETEKALEKSEEQYRLLVENANDAIFIIQDEVVKFPNPKAVELLGYSEKELAKTPFDNLMHPEDRDMMLDRDGKKLAGKDVLSHYPFRIMNKAGKEIWVQINAVFIDWEGRPAALTFLRDITEQRKLQAQFKTAQRMEALGTLAGGIAHDFNNLLMGIQGNASLMLLDVDSSHSSYEKLKNVEQYVKNGADLTKQLLGFARGGKYEVRPIDLNELIKKSSSMFARTKKEIKTHGKYQKGLWTVEADHGQIDQVLLNLYVNAWQAMPGGGELFLETQNVTLDKNYLEPFEVGPGRFVKISITDTGVGMDDQTREKVFEPFFTTKEMGRGTGLGLASVYGIIKNHGGFIDVYSVKNEGTTFNIYLPAVEASILAQKKESEKSIETARGSETILIVDDEKMIVDVGKQLLEKLGYKVITAGSGSKALKIYEKNKDEIEMVILDMVMPGIGGGEAYDRLKKINPEIKVLLASGYSINGNAQEILDRGCNGFIQKPFDIKSLSQKVREVLG